MYNVIQENAENTVDHDAGKINGRFGIVPSDKTLNIKGQIQMLIQKGMGFSFRSLHKNLDRRQ